MKKLVNKNPRELSFTIFETIVAVGLLMAFALEMAGGQGNIVNKVDYARRSNDAIWLAKRIMAQVEYNYQTMDLKELETTTSQKDQKFERVDQIQDFDYAYSVEVKEWKFPLFDFLMNGGKKDKEDENDPTKEEKDPAAAGIPGMEAILDQIFKGHIMKVAYVEVSWPDGARRDKVSLTYLLTNTKALDEYLVSKKSIFDGVIQKMSGANPNKEYAALTSPTCSSVDGEGGRPQDGGGCIRADGTVRGRDGSILAADGTLISGPPAPPTPSGINSGTPNNPGGMPNPPAGMQNPGGVE
jgi:hypothetical protein